MPAFREGAKEILDEYFRKLGGRPEKPQPQPKKRKSMGRPPKSTPEKMPEPKKRRKSRAETATETPDEEQADDKDGNESDGTSTWMPKSRNWEGEVDSVETIIRQPGTSNLLAFLNWKNGKKSKVSIQLCYDKCPKKVRSPRIALIVKANAPQDACILRITPVRNPLNRPIVETFSKNFATGSSKMVEITDQSSWACRFFLEPRGFIYHHLINDRLICQIVEGLRI